MKSDLARPGRHLALQGLSIQAILLLAVTLSVAFFQGLNSALLIMTGGCVGIITNLVFAFFAFRFAGASKNTQVVQSFKKGNKVKLLITVILLFIVFQRPELQRVEILAGYALVLLSHFPLMIILHQWRQRG